jgi:hypothetical protein
MTFSLIARFNDLILSNEITWLDVAMTYAS